LMRMPLLTADANSSPHGRAPGSIFWRIVGNHELAGQCGLCNRSAPQPPPCRTSVGRLLHSGPSIIQQLLGCLGVQRRQASACSSCAYSLDELFDLGAHDCFAVAKLWQALPVTPSSASAKLNGSMPMSSRRVMDLRGNWCAALKRPCRSARPQRPWTQFLCRATRPP
jgi:hypothetical protein